ncbi:MAG: serine/threonine protein kinase [Planctomycetes bacterium]|nr:serine/threonine protein kinase [Planctomycetota bacterium]
MPPAESRVPEADPIESMLEAIVTLPDAEQDGALEQLCRAEPGRAPAIRSRYALFRRLTGATAAGDPATAEPQRFGEYTLVRELGRGGMGVVYLARQQRGEQERLVALKLVRDRLLFSPQARQRLLREGAAAFRIDHPGICQAYDVGEVDGTPFVSMRYVPGRTLAAIVTAARAENRLPELPQETAAEADPTGSSSLSCNSRVRGLLLVIEQVARALHAAHEAGFVHRDVKPGNIMIGPDGAPVLLDFGLVHDESSSQALTQSDQPIGTPTYMSPEQIAPRGRAVDRTTDVYSLGVTLYEALAGEPPFTGTNREELFRKILADAPGRLRRAGLGVSRDLEVVVRTAIDKDPDRRYRTALAFAEDLRRARLAQPIAASPPSLWRRLALWSKRNPLAAAMLALLAISQGAIVALALRAEQRAAEARDAQVRAEADFHEANVAMDDLTRVAQQHLADVPWMGNVRRALFERVLAFHERTAARASVAQRGQAAQARLQAAFLYESLGDDGEARALAESAMRDLAGLDPAAAETLRWSAHGHRLLGMLAKKRGDYDAAEAAFGAAAERLRALAAAGKATPRDELEVAQVMRACAEMLEGRAGRRADARAALQEVLAVADGKPGAPMREEHAAALRLRAQFARVEGDEGAAIADLRASCALLRQIVQEQPHERHAKSNLAATLVSLGVTHRRRQEDREALACYAEACGLQEQLAAAFPHVVSYRYSLANVHNNLSVVHRSLGDQEASRAALARAIAITQETLRVAPEALEARQLLASCSFNLAGQVRETEPQRAIDLYRDCLAQLDVLLQTQPDDRRSVDLAGRATISLGAMLARDQRHAEAMVVFAAATQHTQRLLEGHGQTKQALRNATMLHGNAGNLAWEMGRAAEALDHLRRALRFAERQVADFPDDVQARSMLLDRWTDLAAVQELQDPATAGPAWQSAIAAADDAPAALREPLQKDRTVRFDLARALRGAAGCHLRAGESAAAAPLLARAQATSESDGHVQSELELLLLARDRAVLALQTGDAPGAEAALGDLSQVAGRLAPRLASSPLAQQRAAASWPFLEQALPEPARARVLAALAPLAAAVGR